MALIRVPRHTDVPLEFDGELIAQSSSRADSSQDRWEEYRVWRLADPNSKVQWVVQHLGKSAIPGEVDMIRVVKCKTGIDLRQALRRRDPADRDRFFMTESAYDAFEQAVAADDRLEYAAVERL